jgi:hypothetical protein
VKARLIAYGILAAVAVAAIFAIGRTSSGAGAKRAQTEADERNAAIVARAYRHSRDKTDTVLVMVARQGARVDVALDSTREALAEANATLADTLATVDRLRASLGALTVRAEKLAIETAEYRVKVDSLTLRIAEERAANDRVIAAKDMVIGSLKAERCTINLGLAKVSCPTRTQTAVGAVIGTFLVLK